MQAKRILPDEELDISFARSSGAGGQNVNKVESKVIIHWNIGESTVLSEEEKDRLRKKLENKVTNNDELVVMAEEERSQDMNRERAKEKLFLIVQQALEVPKKRRPTQPTRTSDEKRLKQKKIRSQIKDMRKNIEN